MREFVRKMRWLRNRQSKEAELQEELRFHIEEEAEALQSAGLPDAEARRAARLDLGNATLVGEDTRAAWTWAWLEDLVKDLRYAWRNLAAGKTFAALAVLSLALGIGANTAIYSFMDSILLRALPVPDPHSLVILNWRLPANHRRSAVMQGMSGNSWEEPQGHTSGIFPYPAFEMFRKNSAILSTAFGHFRYSQFRTLNMTVRGAAEPASAWSVTGDYFSGLRILPAAGRLIAPEDDRPGSAAVAVLSYGLSIKRFGSAAGAVGQPILLDNQPFTVTGVAPPEFFGLDPAEAPGVFIPLHANELLSTGRQFGFTPGSYLDPHYYWIQIAGRLQPGVSLAQAQTVLAAEFHRWAAGTAANEKERANLPQLVVRDGSGGLTSLRRRYSQPLFLLMTLVGLILALACANIANLLLARAAVRSREMALRLSLGAGRFRLVRQLLTESVLLASLGGALGILLAIWGMRSLTLMLANGKENFTLHAELNWHVLAVAAGLSLVTGILFGLAPALNATRVDLMPGLKAVRNGHGRVSHRQRKITLSHILTVSQIGISLAMLVAAGLFVRTLRNLESVELGFNRENVLVFRLDARKAGHKDPEIGALYATLRRQFLNLPGVRDASISEDPLVEAGTGLSLNLAGEPPDQKGKRILNVGPSFFSTMQIPILAGRDFQDTDRDGAPPVAIVNEAFAHAYLAGRNPLGQRLVLWESVKNNKVAREMQIVGVCRNARYGGLTEPYQPVTFMEYDQGYPRPDSMVYLLRTWGNPLQYAEAVREIVRHADTRLPVTELRSQASVIDQSIYQQIVFAWLGSGFAILALVIACVGLYGTIAYNVARRTGEIGIRMALGAQPAWVVRMVLREVGVLALAGLAIGLATALAASRLVASFLYGMKANDPKTLALAAAILLATAILAGFLPARTASRIDPVSALRNE